MAYPYFNYVIAFYCKIMSYFRQIGGFTAWEGLLKTYEGEYS